MDETKGFQCLGHSNWTICSPLSPFCSEIFPTFSLSYWGAHSYYPRGPIMRKGNSSNFQYGPDRWVSVPGAFKLDDLQSFKPILFPKFFNLFTFILGSQFLLPQRANFGSWENFPLPNMDDTEGFEFLGYSNRTICSLLNQVFLENFQLLHFHAFVPNFFNDQIKRPNV